MPIFIPVRACWLPGSGWQRGEFDVVNALANRMLADGGVQARFQLVAPAEQVPPAEMAQLAATAGAAADPLNTEALHWLRDHRAVNCMLVIGARRLAPYQGAVPFGRSSRLIGAFAAAVALARGAEGRGWFDPGAASPFAGTELGRGLAHEYLHTLTVQHRAGTLMNEDMEAGGMAFDPHPVGGAGGSHYQGPPPVRIDPHDAAQANAYAATIPFGSATPFAAP